MSACAGCPRANEPKAQWCGSRGPEDARLLLVGMAPGKNELAQGIPFVGGSGRLLGSVFAQVRAAGGKLPHFDEEKPHLDQVRIINSINCYPLKTVAGKDVITKEQFIACRERFEGEIRASQAEVVVPMGGDALWYVTGRKGKKEGIAAWRGYPIFPDDCAWVGAWPTQKALKDQIKEGVEGAKEKLAKVLGKTVVLPPRAQVILPTLHPSFIMRTRFVKRPYLVKDFMRVARALDGKLSFIEIEGEGEHSAPARTRVVAFDIETVGFTWEVERIGLAWRE
jgi:uracil-DNA glycosylase family 4